MADGNKKGKPKSKKSKKNKVKYIRASDARSWTECLRKVWYNHNPPPLQQKPEDDSMLEFFKEKGFKHEDIVLKELKKKYKVEEATSAAHTQQLMKQGAEVIYQPQFVDHQKKIVGHPDFLIKQDDGSYQVADAKLANTTKKDVKIQLGVYRVLVGSDHPAIVYHGNGDTSEVGDEANKMTQEFLVSMRDILSKKSPPSAKHAFNKCSGCKYKEICIPEFKAKDDLSLLYGINKISAEALEKIGITTITQLADIDPDTLPDIPYMKKPEDKRRAVMTAKAYKKDEAIQVKKLKLPRGHWVHFDIESNPFVSENKDYVYLWGLLEPDYKDSDYDHVWADAEKDDRKTWFAFLNKVKKLRQQHPDLILAHYSQFEVKAIERYAERYKMKNNPTVRYLLGKKSPLFDLLDAVKETFIMPTNSYGLKEISKNPKLVNFQWSDEDSGSAWSVVQYHKFLEEKDPVKKQELKDKIIEYNRDDVRATHKLEMWMREQNKLNYPTRRNTRSKRPGGLKP
jgi:uncharacterized protein